MKVQRRILLSTLLAAALASQPTSAFATQKVVPGGISLDFNFRYPPTAQDIANLKEQTKRAQQAICDYTDGQVNLKEVHLSVNDSKKATADVWLFPGAGRSRASLPEFGRAGHVTMYREDLIKPALGPYVALTVVEIRSAGRHTAAKAPVVEAIPKASVESDPTFLTPEQSARYFGTVVRGERRALEVVETALTRAKAGGDAAQVGQLETLRTKYRRQIERHQARLTL